MKRRQKRKLALLIFLVLALALTGLWYYNYSRTKSLKIDLTVQPVAKLVAPQYLFSFAGTATNHMISPIGIVAHDGLVYVADGKRAVIFTCKQDGTFVRTFGQGHLSDPVYLAINPKDGLLYVSDRGKNALLKFSLDGVYKGVFDPNLPKNQQAPANAGKAVWTPVAITFSQDGTMFVTEMLKDQRFLIFAPDGTFRASVGERGIVNVPTDLPGKFQFPNSLKLLNNELWVVDSNNRRVEIFDMNGTYKRLVPLTGLPRGMVFLPKGSALPSSTADAYAVVDTLASMVTLYSTDNVSPLAFGEKGTADGQFLLPNDVTVGDRSIIFVTDTGNGRVEAWGWQSQLSPLPRVLPKQSYWCLLALPLLLVPLLFRKRKYYATADFVDAMVAADAVSLMQRRRVTWLVSEADYERFSGRSSGGVSLGALLSATEYSDTDARALMERYAISLELAATLVSAQRTKLLGTEDPELRKFAKLLEIDVVNAREFRERFAPKGSSAK